MNQIDRDDGQKTQRLYRCSSNYALSKLIMNNGIEDLWRKENLDSSKFTHCDRSSGTRFRIDRVFTRINIASNIINIINLMMVSSTDHYNTILLETLTSKTKIEKY